MLVFGFSLSADITRLCMVLIVYSDEVEQRVLPRWLLSLKSTLRLQDATSGARVFRARV